MTPEERLMLQAQRDELETVMGHMQIELDDINRKLNSSPREMWGKNHEAMHIQSRLLRPMRARTGPRNRARSVRIPQGHNHPSHDQSRIHGLYGPALGRG